MEPGFKSIEWRRLLATSVVAVVCAILFPPMSSSQPPVAYDIEMAKQICDSIALEDPEGVWIYPDDNVTVLVLRNPDTSPTALPSYNISVVESSDCNLNPGDLLGKFHATPEAGKFRLELFTERRKGVLSRPATCIARISDNGETMIVKKEKSGLKFRFSINPSVLLPKMWRIIRIGTSQSSNDVEAPIGMVRIHPSYDGNGSSRRYPRYL